MFITSREKAIIDLIIKTSAKHTVTSIATYLNVSVRTIHRDLKAIEKILDQFQLKLIRATNDGLSVDGKNEHVFRLIQKLLAIKPTDQTPQERKLQLLIVLLEEEESFKIQSLASHLGVSMTTLTTYLDELAEWLERFNIRLTRKRGVGVQLYGLETDKRKALSDYFILFFNEELIESLFLVETGNFFKGEVLHYLPSTYLLEIDKLVSSTINKGKSRLADSDYVRLIVHISITMQRTERNPLSDDGVECPSELKEEYSLIEQVCKELENKFSVVFTKKDICLLAVILKGSKLQEAELIEYDRVMLGQMIKNLIHDVSTELQVDLRNDFSLFQGLLAHMVPSIFRLGHKMGLSNPLTEDIKMKYPVLFTAVSKSLEKEFKSVKFPEDDIAFIVLHFGSALVLREDELNFKALIVCPTGIGTSKMLASRIKKEFTEIGSIDIKSIKEIPKADLQPYDLIISTVRLPFFKLDYILVTPLLKQEDIEAIQLFLKNSVRKLAKNHYQTIAVKKDEHLSQSSKLSFQEILNEIKDVHVSMEAILKHFRIERTDQKEGHVEIIADMVKAAEQEGLLEDAEQVIIQLKDREKMGGLGIPNTEMGLFHCRHVNMKELIFRISYLERPCLVKGMDGKEMYIKSILLMLAPEVLSSREQEILSLISTSLIENNEAIMIFSSANEEMIRKKLETIFYDYLQNNLIKE